MCFVRCFKASDLRHLLARDREKHSKNETSLTNWSADWQLYWLIFNRALLRWEGADIRPNSIWPNSILTLIFVFLHAQIFVAQRRQKKTTRNTHKSITALIQWLSIKSKCVCHSLWGTGLTGFIWDFEVQHCHLWRGLEAAVPDGLHHHVEGTDVFFSDAEAQTKRSRDIWTPQRTDIGRVWKKLCGCIREKRQWKFLVLTSVKYFTSVYDFKKNNWGFDQSTDSNCHLG